MSASSIDVNTVRETGNTIGTVHTIRRNQEPRWFHVDMTTTATAGNRNFKFNLHDREGNIIYDIRSGANQGASQTRHYNFVHSVSRETSFSGGSTEIVLPLAHLMLQAGMYVTLSDENSVDAADSYTLSYQADF